MNSLGSVGALIRYVLRKGKALAEFVLSDSGDQDASQIIKIPEFQPLNSDPMTGVETDTLILANKRGQEIKNKVIDMDSQDSVTNIRDTNIAGNADIQGSKLLDGSIAFEKLEPDCYVGEQGTDITGNVVSVRLDGEILAEDSAKLIVNIPDLDTYNGCLLYTSPSPRD